MPARYIRQAKITNLSCGPLCAVVDLTVENDAGADVGANVDEDKSIFGLSRAAKSLSGSCEIRVVFDDDKTIDYLEKQAAQGDGAPVFQGANRYDDALIHIGDGRNSDYDNEQLLASFLMPGQEMLRFLSNQLTDRFGGCFPVCKRYL